MVFVLHVHTDWFDVFFFFVVSVPRLQLLLCTILIRIHHLSTQHMGKQHEQNVSFVCVGGAFFHD